MNNDARKAGLKKAWKLQERQRLAASIPIPQRELRDLFDHLDRPDLPLCDHSLRHTSDFLRQRGIEIEPVAVWLREQGGYCDCEVIANVEDKFRDILDV